MALSVHFTGSSYIETLYILRCGDIACPMQRGVKIVAELVNTGNDVDALLPEGKTCKAIALAVDVQNFTGLGNGICA